MGMRRKSATVKASAGKSASPPHTINVYEAKTQLSRLLARVVSGEEIVISRSGRPIARLVPFEAPPQKRVLGKDAGRVVVADDFDAPLPEDLAAEFER